jgi:hypothetical protein
MASGGTTGGASTSTSRGGTSTTSQGAGASASTLAGGAGTQALSSSGGSSKTATTGTTGSAGQTTTGGSRTAGSTATGGSSATEGSSKSDAGVPDAAGGTSGGDDAGRAGTTGSGGQGGNTGTGSGTCAPPAAPTPSGSNWVNGKVVNLNDNGGWCWYQEERAVVDTKNNKLVFGSDANGGTRNGQIEVTIYDLVAKTSSRTSLAKMVADDHDSPGLIITPSGNYATMWAGHNEDCKSYFNTYSNGQWGGKGTFDWQPLGCDPSIFQKVTYANLWNMTAENKIYSFVRSIQTSPNLLVSKDEGRTWTYGGRLTSTPQVGYVAGYYKYWGNGVDRIDFVGTEAHPRDEDNSLYHGYVKGGKSYNSNDQVLDQDISDGTQPNINKFTQLFKTGSTVGPVKLNHAWNLDLMRYPDGSIVLLWLARVTPDSSNGDNPDHRFGYARFDGTSWKLTYLGKAGLKLYSSEQDYTGLGTIHPDDPHTIFISSTYDPRDDTTKTSKHEIYQGTTCDNGATWKWTPITANSTKDNIRPLMPKWDASHSALLWERGNYSSMYSYSMEIVGLISDL